MHSCPVYPSFGISLRASASGSVSLFLYHLLLLLLSLFYFLLFLPSLLTPRARMLLLVSFSPARVPPLLIPPRLPSLPLLQHLVLCILCRSLFVSLFLAFWCMLARSSSCPHLSCLSGTVCMSGGLSLSGVLVGTGSVCVSGGLSLFGVLVGTGSVWHSVSVFVLVPGFVCGEQ